MKSKIYRERAKQRKSGVIGYPMYMVYEKLGKFVPTLQKGKEVQITASTDAGKSKLWRSMFLIDIYLLWKKGKTPNFKPRFIIHLLEDTKSELEDFLYSSMIYRMKRVNLTTIKLNSLDGVELTEEEFRLIDEVELYVKELLSFCHIFDNTYNATGLYKNTRRVLLEHGSREYLRKNTVDEYLAQEEWEQLHPTEKKNYIPKNYIPNDKAEHWFVITDYLNLIEGELSRLRIGKETQIRFLDERAAMSKWVFDYGVKILQKQYRVTSINIIQQNAATEQKQFDYAGKNIIDKLKPSRQGYGENKIIARAAQLILGLFSPDYYGKTDYMGFDLKAMNTNYRSLLILKNKMGKGTKEFPLFFNGAADFFCEIPNPSKITAKDIDLIKRNKYYKKI